MVLALTVSLSDIDVCLIRGAYPRRSKGALHLLHQPGNYYVSNAYFEDVTAFEFVEKWQVLASLCRYCSEAQLLKIANTK